MPKISRQVIEQRFTTFEAVQKLLDSARFANEKDALSYIWKTARRYRQPTGFHAAVFEKAYQSYRHFKRSKEFRRYKMNGKMNISEHDDFF